jgi:iron(III) transport system substrate-binding protein
MIPVLDGWRSETGGRFSLVAEDDEEEQPEADLIITGSLADTWDLAEADEFRPVRSETVNTNIDARLRDGESRWAALSRRARVVVYNPGLVPAEELQAVNGYEALRDQVWRGRVCLSSSAVPGNRLLVALLISRHDLREAEIIVREWRANLAASVFSDDSDLLAAIADGSCAIGIADSNSVLTGADPGVAIHWFDSPGATLVDVTTVSVSRHAGDPDKASALLEWLTMATPNALFAIQDLEFPINEDARPANLIADFARYVSEPQSLAELGFLIEEADRLIERAGYL